MKTKIYLLLLILCSFNGFSQETKMSIKDYINFSDLPLKTSNTPSWANQFYENPDQINVNKLSIDIDNWANKEKKERKEKVKKENESEQENELKESISENPIVRFASHFINKVPINWINEDGFIEMPTKNVFLKNAENLEKEKNSKKSSVLANNWSLVGSKEVVQNDGQIVSAANIYYLSVAPTSTNIRLASSETGVLYKTTDGSENWKTIAEYPGPSAFHPTDANKIMLGSNPFRISSDGGATWTVKPVVAECNKVLWSSNGNSIIIATNSGIYVSNDEGLNFSLKQSGAIMDVEFKPGSSTIAYAINNAGVFYKSTDAGLTWVIKPTSYSLTSPKYGFLLAVSAANPDLVTIASMIMNANYDGTVELTKSTNSGEDFASLSIVPVGYANGFYSFVFGISPLNENTYFVSSNSLYKSTNGGLNFSPVGGYAGPFKVHADIQDIVLFGNTVVLSTDGGVSESSDGFTSLSNWKSTCKGLDARDYLAFDIGFNTDQMGGGTLHNGYAIYNPEWNNGKSIYISDGEEAHGKAIFSRPNSMYYPGTGKNFKQVDVTYNPNYAVTYPFTLDNTLYQNGIRNSDTTSNTEDSNIIYAGTASDVVVSYDNGITKQVLKSFNSTVWDIKTTRKDPKVLYVLTNANGLWKTIDGGSNWTICNTNVNSVSLTNLGIYCRIDVSQTNANEVWLLLRNGSSVDKISKSLDGGLTWTSLNLPILDGFAGLQIVHQYGSNGGVYIMGSQNDLSKCYYKNNTMPDWIDYSSGIMMRTSISKNLFLKASYYKEKLRVAGPMGVQEIAFFEKSNPVAQPTTNVKDICVNQEIKFCDYSILDYLGATWEWSFSKTPVYLNGTSAGSRDPIVKFLSSGTVNVTLKVTNSLGQSDTKTITNFVTVNYDSANCILLNSDNDYAVNCVNNLPNPPSINTGQQGVITNFNGATTGKFLVKMKLYTSCKGRTGAFSAIVNLDTNQISTIRYSHFEDGVLPVSVTGDNTSSVTSFSNRYAQVSFTLINKVLYLNHVSNFCSSIGEGVKTVDISELCWQPFTSSGITSGDFAELQKCDKQIPQSAAVTNNTDILVTDFANATTGLFYVNLNAFTSCNNATNNLKAIVNLDSDIIHVLGYQHFASTNTDIVGNETSSVTSTLTTNAQVNYFISNNKLYVKRIFNPCGNGNFRLNPSCWSAMDDDQNGIDNTLQPSNCNNPISGNVITNSSANLVQNFSSFASTQKGVFVTLNI
ncbi:PKD domain-containing protein, partial [Flavobacterium sp.]|uniref:PKD domain-containing protein n=1 Tax=Flavobacterium sp. TaxID=239 RepID=UPI00286CE453